MQRRVVILLAVIAVISGWGLSRAQVQGPTPTVYSITEDPGFGIMGPLVIKLSRDGSKEVVDQFMAAGPGTTRNTTPTSSMISRRTRSTPPFPATPT